MNWTSSYGKKLTTSQWHSHSGGEWEMKTKTRSEITQRRDTNVQKEIYVECIKW